VARRWHADTSPALWVLPELDTSSWGSVGSIMPGGYDAYLRILHPVETGRSRMRWSAVADSNGRIAHSVMQLHMINRPCGSPVPLEHEPEGYTAGSLPQPERAVLIDHLVKATTTPAACWFLVWEGLGAIGDGIKTRRVHQPGRDHLLTCGSVAEARNSITDGRDQSPTMWWPEDRAWFVSTEVDFAWSYLGCTEVLATEILAENRLETFVVSRSDLHDYEGDLLNAALDDST